MDVPDKDKQLAEDDAWRSRTRGDVEQLFADKVPARIIGGAIGSAIGSAGGPVGAVIGGWIGSGSSPVVEYLLKKGNQSFIASADKVVEVAREGAALSTEDIIDWLERSPEHVEIMAAAVRASLETLNDVKIRSLARALQIGLEDDALLDESRLAIAALAQLESMHLRVLQFYVQAKRHGSFGVSPEDAFPNLKPGMPRILSILLREGLTEDYNGRDHQMVTSFGEYVYWLTRASSFSTAPFIDLTYGTTRGFNYACQFVVDALGAVEISDEVGRDDAHETATDDGLERRWHATTGEVDELILVQTGAAPVMWVKSRTASGRKTRKSSHKDFAVVSIFTQRPEEIREAFAVRTFQEMWKPRAEDIPFHCADSSTEPAKS